VALIQHINWLIFALCSFKFLDCILRVILLFVSLNNLLNAQIRINILYD